MPTFIKNAFMSIIGIHDDLYGLDHAILNVTVPPENMWMNMGYWKVCTLPGPNGNSGHVQVPNYNIQDMFLGYDIISWCLSSTPR